MYLLNSEGNFVHILFIPSWLSINKKDEQLGSFFVEQAQALDEQGENIKILYVDNISLKKFLFFIKDFILGNIFKKEFKRNGVVCIPHFFINVFPKNNTLGKILFRKKYINCIDKYIEKNGKPDVIHIQSMSGLYDLPIFLKNKFKFNVVITEHSSGYVLKKPVQEDYNIFKKNIDSADKFLAVSDFYAEYINSIALVNKVEVVPNNLNKDILKEKYSDFNKREKFTFIAVGNLYDIKRHNLLIENFSTLIFNKKIDAELLIVGDGDNRSKLEKLIKINKLDKYIKILGKKDRAETLDLIASSHVLVVSSLIETFSVVTIEALALKTLVISTKCGGPQMLVNENNGILCDDDDLSNSMEYLYKNYSKYSLNKVREDALSKYSPEVISRQIKDIYQGLI